jgi:hypothetical protein
MDFKKSLLENPQTTLSGLFASLGYVLPMFGVPLPQNVSNAVIALGVALVGVFSHDAGNTPAK